MKANLSIPASIDISEIDPGTELYQAVELLEFDVDTVASGLLLDAFELEGEFRAIDINVLATDAPVKAQLEKPNATTWIIRLPRPFQLDRVNVQERKFLRLGDVEGLIEGGFFDHKLPGLQLSVGAAAAVDDRVSQLREQAELDFRAGREWVIQATQLDIFPVIGDKVMDQSIATVGNNTQINNLILDAFAVRAIDSARFSQHNLLVAQHSISVYIHSQPQGLKLALAPVSNDELVLDDITELNGFNLASNQDVAPLENSTDTWLKELQKFVDANFVTPGEGDVFKLGLIFRSENPCRFETGKSDNDYRLLFRDEGIFPDIDTTDPGIPIQQKLAFSATHWQSYSYQLSLPANSVLHSATLAFKHTLNKNAFAFVDEQPSDQWLATAKGVELTINQWAGGIFQLAKAQSVRHLLIPLMATAAGSVCALEVREDIDGRPSGAIITQQSLGLLEVGTRAWMVVTLDEAIALYTKKLWWLVKTTQGSAVQFVQENPQGSGISHFSLSESGGPGAVFRATRELSVNPFFARDSSEGFKLHAFLADGSSWTPVGVTDQPGSNLQQFDLLPVLSGQSQSDGITLRVSSLLKGNAVLYPPEISYELAE